MNVYQIVTQRIMEQLKKGVIPWRKPWVEGRPPVPVNWVTQKPYRGVNLWLLEPGEYATFKQISVAGRPGKERRKSSCCGFLEMG